MVTGGVCNTSMNIIWYVCTPTLNSLTLYSDKIIQTNRLHSSHTCYCCFLFFFVTLFGHWCNIHWNSRIKLNHSMHSDDCVCMHVCARGQKSANEWMRNELLSIYTEGRSEKDQLNSDLLWYAYEYYNIINIIFSPINTSI